MGNNFVWLLTGKKQGLEQMNESLPHQHILLILLLKFKLENLFRWEKTLQVISIELLLHLHVIYANLFQLFQALAGNQAAVLHLGMESRVCVLKIGGLFRYEKDLMQDLNKTWEFWKLQHKEKYQRSLSPPRD